MSYIQSIFDDSYDSSESEFRQSLGDLVLSLLDSAFAGVFSPVQEEHER